MKLVFKLFLPLVLLMLSCGAALAQVSEAEVQLQGVFIDGKREFALGNFQKAVEKFQEVIRKDPQNDVAAIELARTFAELNKEEEAIKYAREAVALEPGNIWYQYFLGDLYQRYNRNTEGAGLYENLTRKYPDDQEHHLRWALFLVRANEPEQAIKVYEGLEKRIGTNEELTRRKHALYLGMGNTKKAAEELQRLIATFPNNLEYRHLLAGFYEQAGEKNSAADTYKAILKIDPTDARAKLALSGNAKEPGKPLEFLRSLKPVFEDGSVNIDLKIKELLPIVQSIANEGKTELGIAALELANILEQVHPREAKAFAISGDLHFHTGQVEQAITKYKRTLELDDTVYLVWEQLLYALKSKGNYADMLKYSAKALDIFPNQAAIYLLNGIALRKMGKPADATEVLEQAAMMSGRNPQLKFDILTESGRNKAELKNFAEAKIAFEEAMKLNPKDPELLNAYAQCLLMQNAELDKARAMIATATALHPSNPEYLDTYSQVLFRLKEYDAAKVWARRALEGSKESDPAILEHYGDVLFQLGQVNDAVQYWQKALDKGSRSPILEKKIAERRLPE